MVRGCKKRGECNSFIATKIISTLRFEPSNTKDKLFTLNYLFKFIPKKR